MRKKGEGVGVGVGEDGNSVRKEGGRGEGGRGYAEMNDAVQSEGPPPDARARPVEKNCGGDVMERVWLLRAESTRETVHEYLKGKKKGVHGVREGKG